MPQSHSRPSFLTLDKLCHQFFKHPDAYNVLSGAATCLIRHADGHISAIGAAGAPFPVSCLGQAEVQDLDKTVHSLLKEASTTLPASVQQQMDGCRSVAVMFREASLVLFAGGHPSCPDFWWYVSDQDAHVAEARLNQMHVLLPFDCRDFPRMAGLTLPFKTQVNQQAPSV